MKKFLSFALVLVLVLGLCACGNTAQTPTEPDPTETTAGLQGKIQAGYAIVKITPEESVPLSGYGNSDRRMSTNVVSDLYATCLALTDEAGTTVLLISMDLQQTYDAPVMSVARPMISQATGVPQENIMLTATHTHSGPDLQSTMPVITRYLEKLNKQWLPQVAQEAMADRMDAELSYGSTETENLNFIKHYYHIDENGNKVYFGDNFGTTVIDSTTQHATEMDTTLHLVQFTREGGKPIVLANWRAHPCLTGSNILTDISADYVGAFRKSLEKMYGCNFIYFQGAAGNSNAVSRIGTETRTNSYIKFGEYLATDALKCLRNNMTPAEGSMITLSHTNLEAEYVKVDKALYDAALTVQDIWVNTNDRNQAIAAGKPYGIRSPYHATALVRLYKKTTPTATMELNAIAIGNSIALVTSPNEMFDTNSVWLEERSPYAMTLTFGYANGHWGYLPSKEAFAYTCYESDVTNFVEGTAELVQENFLRMLNTLAGKS